VIVLSDSLAVQRHVPPGKRLADVDERTRNRHQLELEGRGHERAPLMVRTDYCRSIRTRSELLFGVQGLPYLPLSCRVGPVIDRQVSEKCGTDAREKRWT
jgi:hypothetical protein